MAASNIPSEPKEQIGRTQDAIEGFLDQALFSRTLDARSHRKADIEEAVVIEDAGQEADQAQDGESILSQAHSHRSKGSGAKVVREHRVTQEDLDGAKRM